MIFDANEVEGVKWIDIDEYRDIIERILEGHLILSNIRSGEILAVLTVYDA